MTDRVGRFSILTALVLGATLSFAADPKGAKRDAEEIEVEPPAYPQASDLIEIGGTDRRHEHAYVDRRSVSVGSDRIVRYTLLVRTEGGVDNVTFEAISCDSKEFKILATGDPARGFKAARYPRWQPIEYRAVNNERNVLARDIFCPGRGMVQTDQEALEALQRGMNSKAEPRIR